VYERFNEQFGMAIAIMRKFLRNLYTFLSKTRSIAMELERHLDCISQSDG